MSEYQFSTAFSESCHAELNPPELQSTLLVFSPIFHLLPDLITIRHPEKTSDESFFPSDSLLPSQSVGEEVGVERSQHSHAYGPMALGPAMAGALLSPEPCTCTHTTPQSCQNAAMQSQHPGEEAGTHLSYSPQKISQMFNCRKSILITTRWVSDGGLLSFLSAYPPKATLPEISIFWEASQAHSQSAFDSGFQILLLSYSPDIKAPALPTRKASSGSRDSQPCLWAAREMKLLNMVGIGNLGGLFQP